MLKYDCIKCDIHPSGNSTRLGWDKRGDHPTHSHWIHLSAFFNTLHLFSVAIWVSYSEAQTVLKTSINLSNHLDMISKLTVELSHFFFFPWNFKLRVNILNGDIIFLEWCLFFPINISRRLTLRKIYFKYAINYMYNSFYPSRVTINCSNNYITISRHTKYMYFRWMKHM